MFSRIRGFVNRHKQKFLVGGIVIGSVVFLTRYTQRKLREWQEKEIRDMLEKTKRQQFFTSVEKACSKMITGLAVFLRQTVVNLLDTTSIIEKLRNNDNKNGTVEGKSELQVNKLTTWNELKIITITKSVLLVYSYAMMLTLIRIQFSALGGCLYKDYKDLQNFDDEALEKTVQAKYLALSYYFVSHGTEKLRNIIEEKIREVINCVSLKDEITLQNLEQMYLSITTSISKDDATDPVKNLVKYMIQEDGEEEVQLMQMINETIDMLESKEVQQFTQSNIRKGFVLLVDHVSEYFTNSTQTRHKTGVQNHRYQAGTSKQNALSWTENGIEKMQNVPENSFVNINKVSMPMAKVIPIISGQVLNTQRPGDFPSELIQNYLLDEDINLLAAITFEAFTNIKQ